MSEQELLTEEAFGPFNEVERKNAPKRIFAKGDLSLCRYFPKVSVIGTRKVSAAGLKRTSDLVGMLVERKVVVVSGLALGVDTQAHKTAIQLGGKTIAVVGTPLDKVYPAENAELQKEIAEKHLVISQFPIGYPVNKGNFPMRNRTMALISQATIIVEAGEGSGTVHQGWEALRLGRPLFLLESLVKQPDLEWPIKMIEYGAQVLKRDNTDLLFEILPQGSFSGSEVPF